MKEIWKDIPNYEGLYQVSNLGRVKSLDRVVTFKNGTKRLFKGVIRKQTIDKANRCCVKLCKNNKEENCYVHSLVALSFIGERPKGYVVAHYDGNPQNNNISNLRYDLYRENMIDICRQGSKIPLGKFSIDDIVKIRDMYNNDNYSLLEISKIYDVKYMTIKKIVERTTYNWIDEEGKILDSKTGIAYE